MESEIIKWEGLPPLTRIGVDDLEGIFNKRKKFEGNLADLLLGDESTAVYHISENQVAYLGSEKDMQYIKHLLLGVNYHNGHSEGDYKIIVQNIPDRKGPWVLFRPPGSEEHTFYLQHLVFPMQMKPEFEKDVTNPLKILKKYLHRGNPLNIFTHFEKAGFKFVDEPMTREYMKRVGY